jgi:hypothetical protein
MAHVSRCLSIGSKVDGDKVFKQPKVLWVFGTEKHSHQQGMEAPLTHRRTFSWPPREYINDKTVMGI